MTALQAFTIYVEVLQYIGEAKSAWTLAGVLIRLAVSMRLHTESSHIPNITPFEREMRRRVWWQICLIDSRSGDVHLSRYKIAEGAFDTKTPANIDDANLDLAVSHMPLPAEGWTDTTSFLIRCEIWRLSRRLQAAAGDTERLSSFKHSEAEIDHHLRHFQPSRALHTFMATSAKLFLAKVNLVLHAKQHVAGRRGDSQAADEKTFSSSITIVEGTYDLQNEPCWADWRWQIQGQAPPWHALHVVLNHLRNRSWNATDRRAWSLAIRSLEGISEAGRQDSRYPQVVAMVSALQRNATEPYHHNLSAVRNAQADMTSAPSSEMSTLGEAGSGSTGTNSNPQENQPLGADSVNTNVLGELPCFDVDWPIWDETIESSFALWGIDE